MDARVLTRSVGAFTVLQLKLLILLDIACGIEVRAGTPIRALSQFARRLRYPGRLWSPW